MIHRMIIILSTALYIALLNWMYVTVSSVYYTYQGCYYTAPTTEFLLLMAGLALAPAFLIPTRLTRPSEILWMLLYGLVYIPSAIIPLYILPHRPDVHFFFIVLILVSMVGWLIVDRLPLHTWNRIYLTPNAFQLILIGAFVGFQGIIVMSYGIRFEMISLDDVYELRDAHREAIASESRLAVYAIMWAGSTINPLLLLWGVSRKRVIPIVLGTLGQYLIFTTGGDKIVFFSVPFLLLIYFLVSRLRNYISLAFVGSFGGLCAVSLLFYLSFGISTIYELFPHRGMVTHGVLSGLYLDFFEDRPKDLYSHSPFNFFLPPVYELTPARTIGLMYYHRDDANANVNLWADGYANLDLFGVGLASLVLLGVGWLYNRLSVGRSLILCSLLLVMPALNLANTGIQTTLSGQGLGLLFVFLYFMPPESVPWLKSKPKSIAIQPRSEAFALERN